MKCETNSSERNTHYIRDKLQHLLIRFMHTQLKQKNTYTFAYSINNVNKKLIKEVIFYYKTSFTYFSENLGKFCENVGKFMKIIIFPFLKKYITPFGSLTKLPYMNRCPDDVLHARAFTLYLPLKKL